MLETKITIRKGKQLLMLGFICFNGCGLLNSCTQNKRTESPINNDLCLQMNQDSLITLSGTMGINSDGDFIFKNSEETEWGSGTYLIPCNDKLKVYVESAYNAYLHLKKKDDQFWLMVEGQYLEDKSKFIFSWVALIDKPENSADLPIEKDETNLNSEDLDFIQSLGVLDKNEEIELFYSFNDVGIEQSGSFITKKRIANYRINGDQKIIEFALFENEIDTITSNEFFGVDMEIHLSLKVSKTNGEDFQMHFANRASSYEFYNQATLNWKKQFTCGVMR